MNRKTTSRSLLAMVLALVMVFSAVPAFADDARAAADKGGRAAEAFTYPRGIVEPEAPEIALPEEDPAEDEMAEAEASGEPELSLQVSGDVIETGSTSNATYSVISNNDGADTVTIKFSKGTGSSTLWFYGNREAGIYDKYKDRVTRVEIAEGVTSICQYAFWSCPQLMSVKFPSSLTSIGKGAFAYCRCLSEVTSEKPIAIESIGEEAFARCGPNPSKMVTEITALDGFALARACYAVGSLPSGVTDSPEARDQQVKDVYDFVTQLRIELGLEEMSDVQKVKHIYDWVIQNVEYDYEALDYDRSTQRYSHAGCAHSAIFEHLAICSGYVDILRWLLNESGIDCIECTGGDHAWLIVYLDGAWYALDATWDDQPGIIRYDYFLKSKSSFDASNPENGHSWDDYTGMVTKLYPLSSKNYGEFSSGQYSYLYYGDDYVAITEYRGNASSLTLPETVVYNGDTKRVNIVGGRRFVRS